MALSERYSIANEDTPQQVAQYIRGIQNRSIVSSR